MKPMVTVLKQGHIKIVLGRLNGKIHAQKFNKKNGFDHSYVAIEYSHKYTVKCLPIINDEEYDIAISFLTPHYIVRDKVKAKKKVAWIHTDYSTTKNDVESELKMWSSYNSIISISDDVTKAFLTKFPSLTDKIVSIENILSKDFIYSQSELFKVSNEINYEGLKLLSIGRFCDAKNFDNVPEIASIIKSKGIDFKWYIIGFGNDEELIRAKISEYKMDDTVIILGKKENPYPYIKACDIYIQPSRYEGKAVTVCEALIMNKPVIITDYPTAHSQLRDGIDGVIVPMDNEGCAQGIADVINNRDLQRSLIENTKSVDYTNSSELQKIYDLIG